MVGRVSYQPPRVVHACLMFTLLWLALGRTACANTFTWFGGSGCLTNPANWHPAGGPPS
jgi:hypothetical protein